MIRYVKCEQILYCVSVKPLAYYGNVTVTIIG